MASGTKDVFELAYMRKLRFALNTIAAYPNKALGELNKMQSFIWHYRFVLITLSCLQEYSTISYLKRNFNSVESSDMALTYVNVLLTAVSIQRYFLGFQKNYGIVIKKFIFEFHLMHHMHKTEYTAKIYKRVTKICVVLSTMIYVLAIAAIITYNVVPLYSNYRAGRFGDNKPNNDSNMFEHSVYFDLPIDQYHDIGSYIIVFLYNWYPSYNVASGFCTYDLLMFTIVFHIWGHINILLHDLEHFPRPDHKREETVIQTREEIEAVAKRLKDIIKHHQMIKEFIKATFEAFDLSLCVTLVFHQVTGCVMLLQIADMDPDSLAKYGTLTFIVFQQLIQMSIIFELIRSTGDKLADQVYGLPWENMDVKNRKTVLILLHNVQPTIALKAGGVVPVGVLTMQSIIRTSCSYFVMLRTFTNEE